LGRSPAKRGAKPDLAKRARVAELRAAEWTLKRIGAEVGVSEARVSQLLKAIRSGPPSAKVPTMREPGGDVV
jgi:hypothetical protein